MSLNLAVQPEVHGYHSNTIMNFGLDSDLFWLSFLKSTMCFTELRKQAVKQFHLGIA